LRIELPAALRANLLGTLISVFMRLQSRKAHASLRRRLLEASAAKHGRAAPVKMRVPLIATGRIRKR